VPNFLRLALWNANGLSQYVAELQTFISQYSIDIMLISETHFTDKSYLKLRNYTIYHTNHPAGTARDGSAILLKNSIQHHPLNGYCSDFLQATTVSVEDTIGPLTISAVYLPPKHILKQEQLADFYSTVGPRFLAGGDYNTKHTDWGSRLIIPRGREVLKTMESQHLHHLSTGEPTYWPSDRNKLPDLCYQRYPPASAVAKSCLDLSSDHSPVLITLTPHALPSKTPPRLSNARTNWDLFRYLINERLTLSVSLKTADDIEDAVKFFNDTIQWVGWSGTAPLHTYDCPTFLQHKLQEKRRLRKR
jgi:hypothetical protein